MNLMSGSRRQGGKSRYLLNHRWRVSRQLDQWLGKISEAIERQSAAGQQPPRAEFADYVRDLQRIALGHGPSGSARDRLGALKELLKLGVTGTTGFLEGTSAKPPGPSAAELEMQSAGWRSTAPRGRKSSNSWKARSASAIRPRFGHLPTPPAGRSAPASSRRRWSRLQLDEQQTWLRQSFEAAFLMIIRFDRLNGGAARGARVYGLSAAGPSRTRSVSLAISKSGAIAGWKKRSW